MKVQDIMHRGAECVDDDTPLQEVARLMRQADIGAVPVSAGGELVGIVTDRDITCRAFEDGRDPSIIPIREVMTRNPVVCSPDDDVEDALELMEEHQVRRMPVMRDDQLVGMLALGDVSSRVSERVSGEVLRAVSAHH